MVLQATALPTSQLSDWSLGSQGLALAARLSFHFWERRTSTHLSTFYPSLDSHSQDWGQLPPPSLPFSLRGAIFCHLPNVTYTATPLSLTLASMRLAGWAEHSLPGRPSPSAAPPTCWHWHVAAPRDSKGMRIEMVLWGFQCSALYLWDYFPF